MTKTRDITIDDLPAVAGLWSELHAQNIENNCWPEAPSLEVLAGLITRSCWVVAENGQWADGSGQSGGKPQAILGFACWVIDPDGNAYVRAVAAMDESAYLHLVLACVAASKTQAYGMLNRNRPEWQWYANIGATFENVGYEPMTPAQEAKHATRAAKLAARVPVQDRVIVPTILTPVIDARLAALEAAQ
jgi:hypothetical protein